MKINRASFLLRFAARIWTAPNTLLGLALGMAALPTGARVQRRHGCLEFHGGAVSWLLRRVPPGGRTAAMTLGHVILGDTPHVLDRVRDHEHVHVRQYECWGPAFLPAYLGMSLWLWLRRRHPYLDNPFEIEAYEKSDPRDCE